ncbi:MAG: 4Fe-4S binding protein [Peptococcaceae bacterium]|nr:4Fe-4S binding protein [Peptococcaceae bacterium]
MPPIISKERCIQCGLCVEICPMNVLSKEENKIIVEYPEECWHCRACAIDCPRQAISMRYPLSHLLLHYEVDEGGAEK